MPFSFRKQPKRKAKTKAIKMQRIHRAVTAMKLETRRKTRVPKSEQHNYYKCCACHNMVLHDVRRDEYTAIDRRQRRQASCYHNIISVHLCPECAYRWYEPKATSEFLLKCFGCSHNKMSVFHLPNVLQDRRLAWLSDIRERQSKDAEVHRIVTKKMAQRCPHCPALIYKYEGCDKITCPGCSVVFKYSTGKLDL